MVRKHFKDHDPWNPSREEEEFWEEFEEGYSFYRYYSNEPLIDVRDEGNKIKVILEASGSRERDVRIERIASRYVDISLKHKGRLVRKRIEIQSRIKNAYLLKIKNGVAQIIIEKA